MKAHRVIRSKIALVRDLYRYEKLPYTAQVLTETDALRARQLLAQRYLSKRMIDPTHLTAEGVLNEDYDPFWHRATYFGVMDKQDPPRLHATGRFIYADSQVGLSSLHLHSEGLDPKWRQWLEQVDPSRVVELASLVKAEKHTPSITTLYLFREMLRYSMANNIDHWVFGLTSGLERSFEARFGAAMVRMGEQTYLGPLRTPCTPYVLNVKQAREQFTATQGNWLQRLGMRQIERFMFEEEVAAEKAGGAKPHLVR